MSEKAGYVPRHLQNATPRFSKKVLQEAFGLLAAEQLCWLGVGGCNSISHAMAGREPEAAYLVLKGIFSLTWKYWADSEHSILRLASKPVSWEHCWDVALLVRLQFCYHQLQKGCKIAWRGKGSWCHSSNQSQKCLFLCGGGPAVQLTSEQRRMLMVDIAISQAHLKKKNKSIVVSDCKICTNFQYFLINMGPGRHFRNLNLTSEFQFLSLLVWILSLKICSHYTSW